MTSSSALNKFMRSIIKSDEEKEEQSLESYSKKESTQTNVGKFKETNSKAARGSRQNDGEEEKKYTRANNNNQNNANAATKSIYVKKGT